VVFAEGLRFEVDGDNLAHNGERFGFEKHGIQGRYFQVMLPRPASRLAERL
jgi:hypothetical protein